MADIKENQMAAITPVSIRCVDSAGNSGVVPTSYFVRSDRTTTLSAKTLLQIASAILWERFAALCVIGSSDAYENCMLRVTGVIQENDVVRIRAVCTGKKLENLGARLLYKVENHVLKVYLYSNLNDGSSNPLAIISSHPMTSSHVTDISGYKQVTTTSE